MPAACVTAAGLLRAQPLWAAVGEAGPPSLGWMLRSRVRDRSWRWRLPWVNRIWMDLQLYRLSDGGCARRRLNVLSVMGDVQTPDLVFKVGSLPTLL